jgi:hypothetical protein
LLSRPNCARQWSMSWSGLVLSTNPTGFEIENQINDIAHLQRSRAVACLLMFVRVRLRAFVRQRLAA